MAEKYFPRCRIFLLDGEKFRTNLLVLFFEIPLKRETATETALLAEVLKHRHCGDAVKRAEEQYGMLWDISVVKKGDRQLLLFSLEMLKAVDTDAAVSFLKERMTAPLEEGGFSAELVEKQKKYLKRKLSTLQDNKKAYAQKRVSEETAEGTPFGISGEGYAEDLTEIRTEKLFDFYRELMETAKVKIFFCGEKTAGRKILPLRQVFCGRMEPKKEETAEYREKGPRFVQENGKMEQARLLMGFSADTETDCRKAALLVLNQLLGGSPDSLLFLKIREEQGLCYDVRSYLEPMSPYLFVQAGIREEDVPEAGRQIGKAVRRLQEEGVEKEKLEQAKENILRAYDGLEDSPWAMVDFFAEQVLQGKAPTTEKFLRQIEQVEAEDVMRAAAHLRLQVVYLLSGKEAENGK